MDVDIALLQSLMKEAIALMHDLKSERAQNQVLVATLETMKTDLEDTKQILQSTAQELAQLKSDFLNQSLQLGQTSAKCESLSKELIGVNSSSSELGLAECRTIRHVVEEVEFGLKSVLEQVQDAQLKQKQYVSDQKNQMQQLSKNLKTARKEAAGEMKQNMSLILKNQDFIIDDLSKELQDVGELQRSGAKEQRKITAKLNNVAKLQKKLMAQEGRLTEEIRKLDPKPEPEPTPEPVSSSAHQNAGYHSDYSYNGSEYDDYYYD